MCLYNLEKNLQIDDYLGLQPVDTWVRQVATHMNIIDENDSTEESTRKIVRYCLSTGISPIQFNQGAWYLGANSFKLLLEEI